MSYAYHYGISQNKFHYPKNPLVALLFNPSLLPELLDITDFFNLCILLPYIYIYIFLTCVYFCLIIEIILQYVVFSDWLLSLNNIYLRFIHVISWGFPCGSAAMWGTWV